MNPLPQFQRREVETLVSRLKERPRRLICIFGPRQCGKTTAALQGLQLAGRPSRYYAVDRPDSIVDPSSQYFSSSVSGAGSLEIATDMPRTIQWLVQVWEHARAEARRSEKGLILVLDEIHSVNNWQRAVKGLWDDDRRRGIQLHVVLLGSAPLSIHAGLVEALTGRFELIRMTHWSLTEMASAFNVTLNEYIYFGGYPGMDDLKGDEDHWCNVIRDAIIETTVESDVLALVRVDKPALLRQLFEVGAAFSGQIVSYTKLLGQLRDAGNTTTLARYLELLSRAGLLRGLSKYAGNVIRQRASVPKLQVLNTALMTVTSGYKFNRAQMDRSHWGRLVESAVGAHLCNTAAARAEIFYWREGHLEVDYVVRYGHSVVGIEVKTGRRTGRRQGLEEFGRRFKATRLITVGTGGMPLQEFLETPAIELYEDS